MAEGESIVIDLTKQVESKDKAMKLETGDGLECAVCLQTCVHPAQLPCGHIFCFLCIKGIANQSGKCAMCRQEIPLDFIEHPNLLQTEPVVEASTKGDSTYQWFYEGRDGWWQYDERTSKELEESYKAGEKVRELLIAGFLYIADLEAMLQIRRSDPSRRRRIKRDLATIPKKGIAGLRTEAELQIQEQETPLPVSQNTSNELTAENNNVATPITPSNTPQSPSSEREFFRQDELEATIQRIGNLRLEQEWPCNGDWRTQRRVRTFDV